MSAIIIDGKWIATQKRSILKDRVQRLRERGIVPSLAVVTVGDDPASMVYVRNKRKACEECGIEFRQCAFAQQAMVSEVMYKICDLNHDPYVHGIILQLPLPKSMASYTKVMQNMIAPSKDVDCLCAENVGHLMKRDYRIFAPCTPSAVVTLLIGSGVPMHGKHAVIVGRSDIVGKPLVPMLLDEDCTVTVCHSKTENLAQITRTADILISATGHAKLITADMVKPGAAVIDVGINRTESGKLCGDVDFDAVKDVAGWITPVPGGVGPMTVTMLMDNVVKAVEKARLENP